MFLKLFHWLLILNAVVMEGVDIWFKGSGKSRYYWQKASKQVSRTEVLGRPRWRHRETHCASSHNQKKDNNNLKTKKQPELTENRTVWKSDNQGVKEETFIQTCRRGGEDSQQGSGWRTQRGGGLGSGAGKGQLVDPASQWLVDLAVPHWSTDKQGGTTGERNRPHNPGLQGREIKPQTSDWKHLWGLRHQWEKIPASQESSLERPTGS